VQHTVFDGNGPGPLPTQPAQTLRALAADQGMAGTDQSSQDADQTSQDGDQTASEQDDAAANSDQAASDRDQGAADRDLDAHTTPTQIAMYERSREERQAGTHERLMSRAARGATADARDITAAGRDALAIARDASARRRDARAQAIDRSLRTSPFPPDDQLQLLRAQAASDRARAAADRERAAADRDKAAAERLRLENQLRTAHLDDLTGAYRRDMGGLAMANELERTRRTDGRFVLAFVDVDDMKGVNDRDGHAAGDIVLQALVRIIRSRLRSFDPVTRFGGDEFVCGMSGTDLAGAEQRFREISAELEREVGCRVSFGLASLTPGDTPDELMARADAALLQAKSLLPLRSQHARRVVGGTGFEPVTPSV
jgi:diguanylate cyclase (GGDEF)-like protein